MPKVLRILNRLTIGGPLLNATYLTRYMAPEFETLLVVGQRESHEKDASFLTDRLGIQPVYIPEMERSVNPFRDYTAYRKIKKLIKDFRPDVVHTHAAKPGAIGRMAAASLGVPAVVHTYHGHVFHSYFHPLKTKAFLQIERYLARRSDAIIAISEQQHKELTQDYRIAPPEKFHIIPLGLDLDRFQEGKEEKRKTFRAAYGLAPGTVVITIIGRMVPVKNHNLFLEGIRYLKASSRQPVKAFIVGDGDTRAATEQQATALGLSYSTEKDSVHEGDLVFTSWRTDTDLIVAGSDIIALTSLNEGTPVSLIEAHAAARPVVSTRVGGIEAIVEEGVTGLLSEVSDTEGFCRNLLRLTESEETRLAFGERAAARVVNKYSYQRLVGDMKKLYYALLQRH